jgi:hypothetical protein
VDIPLADVLIHIDEALPPEGRGQMETFLREVEGVVSVHNPDDRPHLTIVQYRPDTINAQTLLAGIRAKGVQAALVGL